jgi:hypothetical protein
LYALKGAINLTLEKVWKLKLIRNQTTKRYEMFYKRNMRTAVANSKGGVKMATAIRVRM